MTARSERERAEQEVIDAAYAWIATRRTSLYDNAVTAAEIERRREARYQADQRLEEAVRAHEALGLAALSQRGATSNNSTDTSAQAAASLGDVSGLARICFDEIVLAGGLTTYQLTQVLGREHQTVSARVNDLMKKGWIVDSGIRRKTGSGRNAIVWMPSLLAQSRMP